MGLGKHLFADFYYCEKRLWADQGALCKVFWDLFLELGLNGNIFIQQADPSANKCIGIFSTGIHLTAHLFPAKNYLGLDILVISGQYEPETIMEKLINIFQPQVTSQEIILRGNHMF